MVLFWAYFMYLWRTWDTKRDPSSMYDAAQAEYDEEFEKVCGNAHSPCTVLHTGNHLVNVHLVLVNHRNRIFWFRPNANLQ